MRRREFLAALPAALALKADAAETNSKGEWRNKQSGMAYRRLGRTGYHVSEIVMGGNLVSPANYDHVLAAMDMGLNYLDTAPAYGNGQSELGYAQVIKARKRDTFFLNSKISLWDINRNKLFAEIYAGLPESEQKRLKTKARDLVERRKADAPDYFIGYFNGQDKELEDASLSNAMEQEYGRRIHRGKNYRELVLKSVDESLARLGTDHLDLLMCPHGANSGFELANYPEIFEAFESLKKSGKVRHLGVSSHTDPAGVIEAALKAKVYSAAMVAYNIVNRKYVESAIEAAHKSDFGVVAMKVARPVNMGRGRPTPPERIAMIDAAIPGPLKAPQKAYVWALKNPSLTAAISEIGDLSLVKDNVPLAGTKPGRAA
ncbi:MAG: aldo/keto reductase [Bryobacteraceae bacterium]|nr:aldo/keto reductase [Bryobacteraceae bacterium]